MLSDSDGKRKGIYNHPIIQKSINTMWFKNKRDEGITFSNLFNPVSVHSIALVLTAVSNSWVCFHGLGSNNISTQQIECNIDKWISGIKTEATFWADDYHGIYNSHILSLNSFGNYSMSQGFDLLGWLQRRLYNYGQ